MFSSIYWLKFYIEELIRFLVLFTGSKIDIEGTQKGRLTSYSNLEKKVTKRNKAIKVII